jgi:hypothetical protein
MERRDVSELEQLVPSLDLCQKLKAAGFPQKTVLVWVPAETFDDDQTPFVYTWEDAEDWELEDPCFAPTAEEILTALPRTILKGQIYVLEAQRRGDVLDVWETDWYFNGMQLAASTTDTISDSLAESAALAYLWWKAQP